MSEAQRIQPLLAELIACAGVFDVSTDYETDKADLEKATRAVLDYVQALRDECERLREALEQVSFHLAQPGDDETPHNQYVPSAAEVGTCQVIILAALTPQGGGKSCAHPRTQWYSGQYEKTLECLDCRVELDERKL